MSNTWQSSVEQQRALAKRVEQEQSKHGVYSVTNEHNSRAQEVMNTLVNYLDGCGLNPTQIIYVLSLMNEYDSAFQASIEGEK